LLHELTHLADHYDFWSGSYSHSAEATREAQAGLDRSGNPFHGLAAYYSEVYQFGTVLTAPKR
jgi:hypothetical protein